MFQFIISPTVSHIQLKFGIWIRQRYAQVKSEYGHGLMIFGRVVPLFSFCSLSPKRYYTLNSNLRYRYILGISNSSSDLVMVRWFLAELCPFHFENKKSMCSLHNLKCIYVGLIILKTILLYHFPFWNICLSFKNHYRYSLHTWYIC
jgi:hypothetical protein